MNFISVYAYFFQNSWFKMIINAIRMYVYSSGLYILTTNVLSGWMEKPPRSIASVLNLPEAITACYYWREIARLGDLTLNSNVVYHLGSRWQGRKLDTWVSMRMYKLNMRIDTSKGMQRYARCNHISEQSTYCAHEPIYIRVNIN